MNRPRSFLALVIAALALGAVMRSRRESVAGRVVCITGGSRGLGLQIAREAAKRGAKVAVLARSQLELDAARDDLRTSSGAELATTLCDVRNRDDVSRAIAHVVQTLGPIDVLVNVAGIISVGPFEALTYDDFTKVMATNFYGQLNAIFEVLPAMRARRDGRIVNVNSIGGRVVVPHLLPYCASKFAAYALSEGLRMEVARDGVAVTTVVPGLMRTGSPPRARFAGRPKAEYAAFAAGDASPLTSVDVAHAARLVLDGCERRAARVVISWQAQAALLAERLVPSLFDAVLLAVARTLPSGGAGDHRTGAQSESALTRSPIFRLSQRAMDTQHELLDMTDRDA